MKPGFAVVAGVKRHFPEGRYQLRTYEDARMIYRDAGEYPTLPGEVVAAKQRAERVLTLKAEAAGIGLKVEAPEVRRTLRRALNDFVRKLLAIGTHLKLPTCIGRRQRNSGL